MVKLWFSIAMLNYPKVYTQNGFGGNFLGSPMFDRKKTGCLIVFSLNQSIDKYTLYIIYVI